MLIRFDRKQDDADLMERLGNFCLFPLRLACGKTVTVNYLSYTEKRPPHLIQKIGAIALTILTFPMIAIGALCTHFSKSYRAALLNPSWMTVSIPEEPKIKKSYDPAPSTLTPDVATWKREHLKQLKIKWIDRSVPEKYKRDIHPSFPKTTTAQEPIEKAPSKKPNPIAWKKEYPFLKFPIDLIGLILTYLRPQRYQLRKVCRRFRTAIETQECIKTQLYIYNVIHLIETLKPQIDQKISEIKRALPFEEIVLNSSYKPYSFDQDNWKKTARNITALSDDEATLLRQTCKWDAIEYLSETNLDGCLVGERKEDYKFIKVSLLENVLLPQKMSESQKQIILEAKKTHKFSLTCVIASIRCEKNHRKNEYFLHFIFFNRRRLHPLYSSEPFNIDVPLEFLKGKEFDNRYVLTEADSNTIYRFNKLSYNTSLQESLLDSLSIALETIRNKPIGEGADYDKAMADAESIYQSLKTNLLQTS